MKLAGQTAVVTGGAVRLGRALSLSLADAGCNVCVHHHHSADGAADVAREISERGRRAVTVSADFSAPEEAARSVFAATVDAIGPPAILINSAAVFEPGDLQTTTAEQWTRLFAVNLQAPFWLCREFANRRIPNRPGHIINIADWRGTRPPAGHLAYTLTKSALVALTRILAQELAPDVQVNAVAPGAILPSAETEPGEFDRFAERIPLRRTGNPADVTDAVLSLLRSDFITGEVLHVTGGEEL